ncbi:MAG: hypothetical protein KC516_04095 [Nanoarchaeota archaeon]|nr:hypothetical protein [Nanoarchaeota archaeon]
MILLISMCSDKLHELEFVKPIENVVGKCLVRHYKNFTLKDIEKADKVIISGTSLKDDFFLKELERFNWIRDYAKPVLGICAGMQIISLIFRGKLRKKKEIGYYRENFVKEFLSLKDEHEVYHLHNNYVSLPKDFIKFTDSKIPQAIKHNSKNIYGVLFHPEVRNSKLIEEFLNLV